jgi:hypothetical protein
MRPEYVLVALESIWDRLPRILGPKWIDLYARVQQLVNQLENADTAEDQADVAVQLVLVLTEDPQLARYFRSALRQAREAGDPTRQPADVPPSRRLPSWGSLASALLHLVNGAPIARFADITAPKRLRVGDRGVITVGLTRGPSAESDDSRPLEVRTRQFLEAYLQSQPEDFRVISAPVQRIEIPPDRDADPAVFYLRGLSTGTKRLMVDFRQAGSTVAAVQLIIEVTKDDTVSVDQLQTLSGVLAEGGSYAPPPDLDIRVIVDVRGGETYLSYVLHSPNGRVHYHYQPAGACTIQGSPGRYQAHVMEKIEALGRGQDMDGMPLTPDQVQAKLVAIGRLLYEELFSTALRQEYRAFRTTATTIQITSDEPWIPWELVKPYDDTDPDNVVDDDYLCARFQLTRWLAGRSGAAGRIHVRRLVCIDAGAGPGLPALQYTDAERRALANLADHRPGVEDSSPTAADASAVEGLLDRGGIGVWHFAAHGNIELGRANEAVIRLSDGAGFRAEDLTGPRATLVSRDRPLVFLNACRVGQQGWSLTQLGGWAAAWVGRCRCGAFLGPLWAVDDWIAFEFARAFYQSLDDGLTFGQAANAARARARSLAPDDPTWLAYSIYAHPNGRLQLGSVASGP